MDSSRTSPKILIVDDDPDIRRVLRCFLENKGYRIATADNGREALGALEKFAPDLVLLDIAMPIMNGMEALQQIRRSGSRTAVMMITGNMETEPARRCMELGACDYFMKPFDFEYLELSVWAKITEITSHPF